jgi:hypothetical protein
VQSIRLPRQPFRQQKQAHPPHVPAEAGGEKGVSHHALQVAKLKFAGTFVDANAISPATAAKVGAVVRQGGARE